MTSAFNVTALIAASVIPAGAAMPAELAGRWCTTKILSTSNVQALSTSEAQAFARTTIQFAAPQFKSGTRTVPSPRYVLKTLRAGDLVSEFRVLPSELGITATYVHEVEVKDRSGRAIGAPGDMVLIKSRSVILWFWQGVFFEAKRCDTKASNR